VGPQVGCLTRASGWLHSWNYFCDKWKVGCECEQGLSQAAYAKIAGAVVFVAQLDAHPAFCRSLGKLQDDLVRLPKLLAEPAA